MKTMQGYTTYCTAEQTIRAYKLGAPIGTTLNAFENGVWLAQVDNKYLQPVTTQQMIGWLREMGAHIIITPICAGRDAIDNEVKFAFFAKIRTESVDEDDVRVKGSFKKPEQAELAAIDAALDRLD